MLKSRKNSFLFFVIPLFLIIVLFFMIRSPWIVLSTHHRGQIQVYAQQLVDKLNRRHFFNFYSPYKLYLANFDADTPTPKPQLHDKNILWLGGYKNLTMQNLFSYDVILTSTPLLCSTLKKSGIQCYYFPMFASQMPQKKDSTYAAVIGNPPFIEDILNKKNIPYKKYSPKQRSEILKDMPYFSFAVVEDTFYAPLSLDLNPLFLEIAAQNIPIATHWSWPDIEEPINLFNDSIYFYMFPHDAETLVEQLSDVLLSASLTGKSYQAQELVFDYYSINRATDALDYILNNKEKPLIRPIKKNKLNIDLPVSTGHIGSGDYWLAQDLISYFKLSSWNTSLSYYNSPISYYKDVNLIVRGHIPIIPEVADGAINILYLAYATEDIISKPEEYIETLKNMLTHETVQALVVSSQALFNTLSKHQIKAYYVPQFTNTKKFYPDYREELQEDVLFVGNYLPYRQAVFIVKEAGLPITIYGDRWPEGFAKDKYIDNRILRQYYSSAKIVLNDTREGMKQSGFIINRIFDATACGSLVISDYMKEIEDVYGDSVPMWKTKEELISLVKYYLDPAHEKERKEKAERARQITLKYFTAEIVAQQFMKIIEKIKKERGLKS